VPNNHIRRNLHWLLSKKKSAATATNIALDSLHIQMTKY
jgi:hypothetical protein